MNRQEIRYKAKQRRAREVARKRMFLLLAAVLLIVIGCIVFGSIFSSAQASAEESGIEYKYYKSIVIEEGDTLWSIAKEYRTDAYSSTQEYIDKLIELNDLSSDTIHAGQHLVVAYYDKEFK
ncbi:MAG: LysM peptidoglycan-binding domain-containing protein [Tyzzerella sp.]|nr:LysM peptidoglycan-binding domain-containing protein [Tyzzerella sp.]